MTGRQRTFELIPTSLVKPAASRPPMTSKAAKKAYQQAQKGPRISKAEQRRRDAEEFERIKKEHEREKAAAKARAVREKKAAKANAEREARKAQGLPEPSKFVRASQPTISKFVRGDRNEKRSWQQMGGVAEETDGTRSDAGIEERDEVQPPPKRAAVDHESEDEFGDFPSLSQSTLEKIDSSAISLKERTSAPASPAKKQQNRSPKASQELPTKKGSTDDEDPFEDEDFTEMVATHVLSEAAEAISKSDALEPPAVPPPPVRPADDTRKDFFGTPIKTNRHETQPKAVLKDYDDNTLSNSEGTSVLQERSVNMPPPRLPLKKPSISFAAPQLKPEVRRTNSQVFSRSIPTLPPPSSTQAFLEAHVDDFFPSPTQQVRELLEDVDDILSNTQIAKEIGSEKPTVNDQFKCLICTQDLVLTPQELEEITSPSRAPNKAVKESKEKESRPPPTYPLPRSKPRFFEEKEDDLLQAALHESKTSKSGAPGKQGPESVPAPRFQQPVRAQRTPRAPRFFEEKEEDILQAALHESKISAAKQTKSAPSKAPRQISRNESLTDYGNFDSAQCFDDMVYDEDEMLQAGIQESKNLTGLDTQKVPLKEAPQKTKRTLKRVQSTATDYGDDEFSGCSQELLALC